MGQDDSDPKYTSVMSVEEWNMVLTNWNRCIHHDIIQCHPQSIFLQLKDTSTSGHGLFRPGNTTSTHHTYIHCKTYVSGNALCCWI